MGENLARIGRADNYLSKGAHDFSCVLFSRYLTGNVTGKSIVFTNMNTPRITLMPRLEGPSVVPHSLIAKARSYREAVLIAWHNRRVTNLTKSGLCERTGMRASHVADYLSEREFDERGKEMRDMPAKYLPAFEAAVGNSFASQWLAMQSQLTVLEAQIAEQKAKA